MADSSQSSSSIAIDFSPRKPSLFHPGPKLLPEDDSHPTPGTWYGEGTGTFLLYCTGNKDTASRLYESHAYGKFLLVTVFPKSMQVLHSTLRYVHFM